MLGVAALMVLCSVGCTGEKATKTTSENESSVTASVAQGSVNEATKEAVAEVTDALQKARELKNYTLVAAQEITSSSEATPSTSKVVYQYDSNSNNPKANVDLELKTGTDVDVNANLYYADGYSYASMGGNKVKTKEEYDNFSQQTMGTVVPFTLSEDAVKSVEKTETGYKFNLDSSKTELSSGYLGNGYSLGDIVYEVAIDENGIATKQSYTVDGKYTEENTEPTTGESSSDELVTHISVEVVYSEIDSTKIDTKTDLNEYSEANVESMEATSETSGTTKATRANKSSKPTEAAKEVETSKAN